MEFEMFKFDESFIGKTKKFTRAELLKMYKDIDKKAWDEAMKMEIK